MADDVDADHADQILRGLYNEQDRHRWKTSLRYGLVVLFFRRIDEARNDTANRPNSRRAACCAGFNDFAKPLAP
jgi:hypothetical protein